MFDYSIYYKSELPVDGGWPEGNEWDLFISSYTSSERVQRLYEKVLAKDKHWLVFPGYGYNETEYPPGCVFAYPHYNEAEFIIAYTKECALLSKDIKICIDMTGFLRPHVMFLIRWIYSIGIAKFDVLYSEPIQYTDGEKTTFSDENVIDVRQVAGFEGIHSANTSSDMLVIGVGYDHKPVVDVVNSKNHAKKIKMFGLPSLKPDMYQQNVLRAYRAAEAIGIGAGDDPDNHFAPANDPFITANVLRDIVKAESYKHPITNWYLTPLSTKPQTLGFTLYYLSECIGKPVSIIYPICNAYNRETSKGLSRIWKYTIELP